MLGEQGGRGRTRQQTLQSQEPHDFLQNAHKSLSVMRAMLELSVLRVQQGLVLRGKQAEPSRGEGLTRFPSSHGHSAWGVKTLGGGS